jgi:CheY-like chemotaxis protein
LATLLGGSISVKSELGLGSTFAVEIPSYYYVESPTTREVVIEPGQFDPNRLPVLIVEDEVETQLIYEKFLKDSSFQPISAHTLRQARQVMQQIQPRVIILDIALVGEETWTWLAKLKDDEANRHIPILMVTKVEDQRKALALGVDAYYLKPIERQELLDQLTLLTSLKPKPGVLVIDDEERFRYLLKKLLAETGYLIHEAMDGAEGIYQACQEHPQLIFLDLIMPGKSGFEVLAQLKADPVTRTIPVVIVTSKLLTEEEQQHLQAHAQAILSKETLSSETVLDTVRQILSPENRVLS